MELIQTIFKTVLDPETWIIILVILAIGGIAGTIHFALKLNEAKKWSEIQDSMYVSAIMEISELRDKLKELKKYSIIDGELLKVDNKLLRESAKSKKQKIRLSELTVLQSKITQLKRLNGGYSMTINELSDKLTSCILREVKPKEDS